MNEEKPAEIGFLTASDALHARLDCGALISIALPEWSA